MTFHTSMPPQIDRLTVGRDAIGAAIQRLFRALDPEDEAVVETLQHLVDQMLDEAPAASTMMLERRLLGLAAALEELGGHASHGLVIRRAIECSDRMH